MIEIETGSLLFADLSIGSHANLEQLMELPNARVQQAIGERKHLSLGIHYLKDAAWGIGALFEGSTLSQIWLQWLNAPGVDVDEHSMANEQVRKVEHDRLLRMLYSSFESGERHANAIGFNFAWGRISSELDMRGVQALIVISYLR